LIADKLSSFVDHQPVQLQTEGLVVGQHLVVYLWLLLSTTLDHKFHDFPSSALGQLLNPALV